MATANATVELRDRLLGQIAYIFSEYKFLALLLIAGFLVRVWATRWKPFPIDMNDWIAWASACVRSGPAPSTRKGSSLTMLRVISISSGYQPGPSTHSLKARLRKHTTFSIDF